MDKEYSVFSQLKTIILSLVVFLFPLFFLPITQDFFIFNKLYLLAAGALALLLVSSIEIFVSKKIVWQPNKIDRVIVLFATAVGLSTLISSPNKVQAVLNGNFGLISIFSLSIITFYLVRTTDIVGDGLKKLFLLSSAITSVIALIFFFQPFKSANLSLTASFLKSPYFNTVGNLIDLSMLLGFALAIVITFIVSKKSHVSKADAPLTYTVLVLTLVTVLLSMYTVIKPLMAKQGTLPYPPLRLSWAAAVDTLKNPVNAVFGIGPDNFAAIFTREKDTIYNQSAQWQINSFNVSRSGILQIVTEGGLLSLAAFVLIVLVAFRQISEVKTKQERMQMMIPLAYAVALLVLFPPSLILFFIFFMAVAYTAHYHRLKNPEPATVINAASIAPIYIGLGILGIVLVCAASFFLGKIYLAEYTFRNAIVADAGGDLQTVYDDHVRAIILNPNIEGYRLSFSRVNMFIANSIANKAQSDANKAAGVKDGGKNTQVKLTDQQKQNITERIQVAISESKAAVALNPQKAVNWENLAVLYRNLLSVAQSADAWTVSAYQRAISIDPNNPIYRLNLGGVYYQLGDFNNAQNLFSQAANLKQDWPNAFYNLAWASYEKKDYQIAVSAMQSAISLLNPKTDAADYKKATSDLNEFKKKLPPTDQTQQTPSGTQGAQSEKLTLPTQSVASVEPKIQLPKDASPEAQPIVTPTAIPLPTPAI